MCQVDLSGGRTPGRNPPSHKTTLVSERLTFTSESTHRSQKGAGLFSCDVESLLWLQVNLLMEALAVSLKQSNGPPELVLIVLKETNKLPPVDLLEAESCVSSQFMDVHVTALKCMFVYRQNVQRDQPSWK